MEDEAETPTGAAPDAGQQAAEDADDSVTLTLAQLKSIENSIWAKARRTFAGERPPKQPQQDDPRVRRGLELLAQYERSHDAAQEASARIRGTLDGMRMTPTGRGQQPVQQPGAPSSGSRLEQLFEQYLTLTLAEKMPAAPTAQPPLSAAEQVNARVMSKLAEIPEDDPRRREKIQTLVRSELRGVKLGPHKGGESRSNTVRTYGPLTSRTSPVVKK